MTEPVPPEHAFGHFPSNSSVLASLRRVGSTRRENAILQRLRRPPTVGVAGVAGVGVEGVDGADGDDGAVGVGVPIADAAMAGELIVVESSIVIAGGTTTANLPAVARKARRSGSLPRDRVSCGSILVFSIEQGACQMMSATTSTGSTVTVQKRPGSATEALNSEFLDHSYAIGTSSKFAIFRRLWTRAGDRHSPDETGECRR